MSFGGVFDGYCVIHAPKLSPERRAWFERELRRVGVARYEIVEARMVSADDPRLKNFHEERAERRLSLIDTIKSAVDLAESRGWKNVVIMEDDVVFRRDFDRLWAEVEARVLEREWDVLTLYRFPLKHGLAVIEPPGPTGLLPLMDNLMNHCMVVDSGSYDKVRSALDHCAKKGWHADFMYGYLTRGLACRLMATDKNLAGQTAGFRSTLSGSRSHPHNFYGQFHSCRSPLERLIIGYVYSLLSFLKRFRAGNLRSVAGFLAAASLFLCSAAAEAAESFAGPFPSWRDVRAVYGAAGDGKTDDTPAIQRALDDLRLHKDFCVLYFPAGTYRITGTLVLQRGTHTEGMGVSIVGEDPARTVIRWDGPAGGTMLELGIWYSKVSRLTLDGSGKADVCLAYGPGFSTYNETSDMVFMDAGTGLLLGRGKEGQAENALLRCHFIRCSKQGVLTTNFNSMDIWAWYCRFEDCKVGMMNGAGNFHAYQCLFLRSTDADIKTANLMVFSFVNNTSIGSGCFIDFSGGHSWGSPTSITGNRVYSEGGSPIRLGNGGPYLVADNHIMSPSGLLKPAIELTWGDQVLIGNRYSAKDPVMPHPKGGRQLRIDDGLEPLEYKAPPLPPIPPTPPPSKRRIVEVPAGADAGQIQRAIDDAASSGEPTVVHLPKGRYVIDQTLEVPAGSPIELIGDGAAETATVLSWAGEPFSTLIKFKGPSKASMRDIMIESGAAGAMIVENADQPGGKIYANQLSVFGQNSDNRSAASLMIRGLDRSDVQLENFQGGDHTREWIKVIGGREAREDGPVPGRTTLYCGAGSTADKFYSVSKGAQLVSRSVYHEISRNEQSQVCSLDDAGSLTLDSTRFSCKTSVDLPLVETDGFRGDFTMTTCLLLPVKSKVTARLNVAGDGSRTRFLCLANVFWCYDPADADPDELFQRRAVPPAKAGMAYCNLNINAPGKGRFAFLDHRGDVDDAFVRDMLRSLRESRIWIPSPTPPAVTDFRLHRVICRSGKSTVSVEFRASGPGGAA